MLKNVHVIINPASGIAEPVLTDLNWAFKNAEVDWEALITKDSGDAAKYAREALKQKASAVAVYGGDGTVMEVAEALKGTDMPMAILPGGTANVMSKELGIPVNLPEAIALMLDPNHELREVDLGETDDACFMVRLSLGFLAAMEENAERESKSRLGILAYAIAGLQAIRDPQVARYDITIDGEHFETDGVAAFIANTGNAGIQGLSVAHAVSVSDGLLDLLVIRQADIGSLLRIAASAVTGDEPPPSFQQWQGREIIVKTDPVQSVTIDGEPYSQTPITARISKERVKIIVPRTETPPATE